MPANKTFIPLLSRVALGALTLGLAQASVAQQAPADGVSANDAEAIIITGSRIRGIAPVGSNVIAIDAAQIMEEPVISTNDMLRRVPQVVSLGANRAGGSAQNGAANATRGAGINLRGLSTNATLLLYDGRRFPPQGTQGQFTDPSVIPSIALGRIEVVADGASAIYGSDAVAGVVNFILRKDFNGIEARARYGVAEGTSYDEQQYAVLAGHKWQTGWIMAAGEFSKNKPLYGADLSWYQADNRYRGGRDLRSTNCDPGTITTGGKTYAIPTGGVTSANVSSLTAGTSNRCFYGALDPVIASQERTSIVAAWSQELGSDFRIFGDGFYSYRKGTLTIAPTINATVPSTNPFFVSPVTGVSSVTVTTSLVPTIGLLPNPYHTKSWNYSFGAEAKPFGDFRATLYYAQGRSEEVAERTRSGINGGALTAALADTNPATALNVFGGANNPATIAKITDNLFVITGKTRLEVLNGQVDGSLFALPGGNVRVAVGAEHRVEYTFTDLLTGQSTKSTSVHDGGSRDVDALFGELFVPIVGASNATAGLEQLSLSLALRHERYSDFGATTNPKVGVTWKPFSGLSLKGTYGTSFRAPTFTEVSTIAGGAGLYFDTLPGPSGNQIGIGIAGGNPGLKPETATTWSFTAEATPDQIPGLMASLSYFRIDYSNQIQALRGTPGLLTNPIYASFVKFNPTPTEVAALVNSGLPINAAINQSQVTFIADGRRQNLGTSLMRGLDFSLAYQWDWGGVKLDAGVQGTYLLDFLFEAVPGAGFANVNNTIGFSPRFRSQADLGAKYGNFRARVTWNYLNSYTNTSVSPIQKVRRYNTVDLSAGYEISSNFSISADVRNLFNQKPPFVDSATGWDAQAASPFPRMFGVTASAKF